MLIIYTPTLSVCGSAFLCSLANIRYFVLLSLALILGWNDDLLCFWFVLLCYLAVLSYHLLLVSLVGHWCFLKCLFKFLVHFLIYFILLHCFSFLSGVEVILFLRISWEVGIKENLAVILFIGILLRFIAQKLKSEDSLMLKPFSVSHIGRRPFSQSLAWGLTFYRGYLWLQTESLHGAVFEYCLVTVTTIPLISVMRQVPGQWRPLYWKIRTKTLFLQSLLVFSIHTIRENTRYQWCS